MKRIFLLCIAFHAIFFSLNAIEHNFTHFTIKDSLRTNTITKLFQDSRGYFWVGTNRGLYRYDGSEFKFIEAEFTWF